jgi:signal peptidase I
MRRSIISKILKKSFTLLPYIVLTIVAIPIMGMSLNEGLKLLGRKTIPVPVVGTGSMYPSLFWAKSEGGPEDEGSVVIEEYRSTPHLYKRYKGMVLFGKKYLEREINHGDMVAFQSDKTREILAKEGKDPKSGYIKRVIAVPGDTIELRDGFVYLNGQLIAEPYISAPRSTYGGEFLKDCHKLSIPENTYFVLGDNRKVSSDSRFELGLVKKDDIQYVLPLSEQKVYHSLWRDTAKDDELLGEPTLISEEFISLVNEVRTSQKIATLKTNQQLISSAIKRGEKVLRDQKTAYSMKQTVADAGYTNIVLGEFVSHGRFSSKELLENLLYSNASAKQILNQDFSDIGVAAVNRDIDGCPSQVIVGHLGGYVPAQYDQATVDSWKSLASSISSVLPSWESAVGHEQIDQSKLSSLLSIFYRRLELAREIVSTMEKKSWLTEQQQARIKADESDAKQAEILVKELNKE